MVPDISPALADLAGTIVELAPSALRLAAAAALGGLIGMERGVHGQSAGLRTQMLVAVGAALAMLVSLRFADVFLADGDTSLSIDPARVAYGVMGGIGFLGAGAILRYGTDVRGLTTAASLWCTAAVGLACGFGMYAVAIFATAVILFILWAMKVLDRALPRPVERTLTVAADARAVGVPAEIRRLVTDRGLKVRGASLWREVEDNETRVVVTLTDKDEAALEALAGQIAGLEGVRRVRVQ